MRETLEFIAGQLNFQIACFSQFSAMATVAVPSIGAVILGFLRLYPVYFRIGDRFYLFNFRSQIAWKQELQVSWDI